MDNPAGFKAQFYNMEDGSVLTRFGYKEIHQSFPQRVHGGLIATMLDELACRAYWVEGNYELGVTTSIEVKYRKPVPYDIDLFGQAIVVMDKSRMFKTKAQIIDSNGLIYADALVTYLKLPQERIVKDINMHDELTYMVEDNITEFDFDFRMN